MLKYWTSNLPKSDNLILIADSCIYKSYSKGKKLEHEISEIKKHNIPDNLIGTPYSYIKKIESQINHNKILIHYGSDSTEFLNVDNKSIKKEIFNFLKLNIPNTKHTTEYPSLYKYAKAEIFIILLISGMFLWSLYLSIEIENGSEYELVGRPGLGAIALMIASLGTIKVLLSYISLLCLAIYSLLRKSKKRSEIETLSKIA